MILIACGLQREAKLLAGPGIIAVPGGGDAARLDAALEDQLERFPGIKVVMSCGIAGALSPALAVGDIVLHLPPFPGKGRGPASTSDVVEGENMLPTAPQLGPGLRRGSDLLADLKTAFPHAHHGSILGQDHIAATAAEKAALFAATGALAVDMESHIAARVAAHQGLPFAAIRTISDTAHESLPPAALLGMNPDGSMALGRVLLSLARNPAQLPALIRIGRSAEVAFKALKEAWTQLAPMLLDRAI